MPQAAEYSAIELLRNGRRVEIRALRPQDRDDMLAAVGRTSAQSLYRRFFGVRRHFTEEETAFFLNVAGRAEMSTRPSVMGRVKSSPPSDRHVAELALLSVVGAEAATQCCQRER